MLKIEIIHNKEVLIILKNLLKAGSLTGFTSILVHEGYGPLRGEYKEDHIGDEQFITMILLDDETQVGSLMGEIKQRSSNDKFIFLKSTIQRLN